MNTPFFIVFKWKVARFLEKLLDLTVGGAWLLAVALTSAFLFPFWVAVRIWAAIRFVRIFAEEDRGTKS
jgi:hypothetical protein